MENVQVAFEVKMDKSIYEDSPWNTREKFFNQLVVSHIADDVNVFKRSSEKEKYSDFIKVYEKLKDSIDSSIKYELLKTEDNIETINITFNFSYYDNPVHTKEEVVGYNIFNKTIVSNNFLVKSLPKMGMGANPDKVKSAIEMYSHVSQMMAEAIDTIKINGQPILSVEKTTKKKM